MIILKTRSEVRVTVTQKWYGTLHHPKMHPHTKFGILISNIIRDMLQTQFLKLGQGHSDLKMVCDTLPSQDAFTHQILNYYLKEYKRYAPDTIILKTRSEVRVTVTRKWYVSLRHPKMQYHNKFGFPISKNIGDMQFLETRSEVKVTVT